MVECGDEAMKMRGDEDDPSGRPSGRREARFRLLEDPSPIDDVITFHLHRRMEEASSNGGRPQDGPEAGADPIDVVLGRNLRVLRRLMNLSRSELADRLGVSPQQMERYESAQRPIGAAALWRAARALDCEIGELFEGLS